MFMEENTGERINQLRTRQALATGADVIAVACPYCLTMFADGLVNSAARFRSWISLRFWRKGFQRRFFIPPRNLLP